MKLFLYDVEFPPYQNPPGTKDRCDTDLGAYFVSRGLDYGMSALGGNVRTRGDVRRRRRPVKDADRHALGAWIQTRPVRCIARLGAVERLTGSTEFFRDITEWVFEVDNLTDDDRRRAAEYEHERKAWALAHAKRAGPAGDER